MPTFGKRSREQLATAHPLLQMLFHEVIKERDCAVLEGHRSLERQAELFARGLTKKKSGGKHNTKPAQAVDVVPWPIDWDDTDRFDEFAAFVMAKAKEMGIRIRWGGNWKTLVDRPHYEITDGS